jgi:hypothetical protein
MTKKLIPYFVIIFVSLLFQSTYGQVNPDINSTKDTIRISGVVDTISPPAGNVMETEISENVIPKPHKTKCDTIGYKVRTYINQLAEATGYNRFTAGLYNFLEIRQPGDSLKVFKHSPKKAAWFSAIIPGLGQIYNRKYWKLPIVYVGFGVIGYLGYNYNLKANRYKSTYLVRSGIDPGKTDYYPQILNKDVLYQNFTYYRRNFELTCIFGSLFYVLNIIDASVDAHLYKFDISEDLSLRIEPDIINYTYTSYNNPSTGLKLSLHF